MCEITVYNMICVSFTQILCHFYVRDLNICELWYLLGSLEPI